MFRRLQTQTKGIQCSPVQLDVSRVCHTCQSLILREKHTVHSEFTRQPAQNNNNSTGLREENAPLIKGFGFHSSVGSTQESMLHDDEDKVMKASGIFSDGSSRRHSVAPSTR